MSRALVASIVLAAFVGAAVAVAPSTSSNRAVYLGYNATYCRGLNFTMFVPGNCSAFYQCQNNNVWLNQCQYPLMYNHLNGFCDHPWNVRCNRSGRESREAPTTDRAGAIYIGYNATYCRGLNFTTAVPGNCSAFYQCQNNNIWLNYCQAPLMYNHINGFCDYAWNVRCNRSSVSLPKEKASTIARPPVGNCPQSQMVMCFVDPCMMAKCPAHPTARCHSDYCRGCNARFFLENMGVSTEVTYNCGRVSADPAPAARSDRILYPPINQCEHQNACFVAPCDTAPACDNIPEARCFDDYCGGCNARWFRINTWQSFRPVYEEVSDRCRAH